MTRSSGRTMADPVHREMTLVLYRAGIKDKEVAHAMGISEATLRKEMQLDPLYKQAVQDAKTHAFEPVIKHAIELALQADEMGLREGSLKAMDMVMRHYAKVLDHEHQAALLERKIEAAAEGIGSPQAGQIPLLVTPEAAIAFAKGLGAGPEMVVEDAEIEED